MMALVYLYFGSRKAILRLKLYMMADVYLEGDTPHLGEP
jgi:hypothetical protein